MRYSQAGKMEVIRLVEGSDILVKRTLEEMGVPRSTFYDWYGRYQEAGYDGRTGQPQLAATAVLEHYLCNSRADVHFRP